MRKTNPVRIGDILKDIIGDGEAMQKGLAESRALGAWSEVVGPLMAESTTKLSLRSGRMYVSFSSAAARSEFFMRKSQIVSKLNEIAGQKVVNYISIS